MYPFFSLLIYNVPAFSSCIRLLSSQLMVTREEISRLGCGSHGSLLPGASAEGGGGQGGLSVSLQFAPSLPGRLSRGSCDCQPGESSCDCQGHGMNRGLRRSLSPHSRYFPQAAGELSLPHCWAFGSSFPTLMSQRQKGHVLLGHQSKVSELVALSPRGRFSPQEPTSCLRLAQWLVRLPTPIMSASFSELPSTLPQNRLGCRGPAAENVRFFSWAMGGLTSHWKQQMVSVEW